jgi:hypothetical protein
METEKEHGSSFFSEGAGHITRRFLTSRKDSNKFPDTIRTGNAAFDYNPASDTFKPDPTGVVNCGFACHTRVAAKDYIFTAYGQR